MLFHTLLQLRQDDGKEPLVDTGLHDHASFDSWLRWVRREREGEKQRFRSSTTHGKEVRDDQALDLGSGMKSIY
jgi:hypothetical protein